MIIDNILRMTDDNYFMRLAIKQSLCAYKEGEVPVGAVAVCQNKVIAKAHNQVELLKDATAHAEMILLTQASAAIEDWRLNEVTIYVTKEPCAMCAGAMVNCRLGKLVYGIKDPKYGAAGSALNVTCFDGALHKINVIGGVLENECLDIFQRFFKKLRTKR
jgi:tRNA(adenine34) deaminase